MISAFEKLWNVLKNAAGIVPWLGDRFATVEAKRIKLIGAATTDVEVERERALAELRQELQQQAAQQPIDIDYGLIQERARFRTQQQERKRQINLEMVASGTVLLLPEAVPDEPLDDDWIARFFDYVQDVSRPELQRLWSAILAGQVAAPTRFSMRTLDVLRNISVEEAQLFAQISAFILSASNPFLPSINLDAFNLPPTTLFKLKDAGLLGDEVYFAPKKAERRIADAARPFHLNDVDIDEPFASMNYSNIGLGFFPTDRLSSVHGTILTSVGCELVTLTPEIRPRADFLRELSRSFSCTLKVRKTDRWADLDELLSLLDRAQGTLQ